MIVSRWLRIRGSGHSERIVELQERVTIGRAVDNDIVLEDVTVSRCHVLLFICSEDMVLVDLDSTNGTFVNGTQALPDEQVRLVDGDVIVIGDVVLHYAGGVHPQQLPSA